MALRPNRAGTLCDVSFFVDTACEAGGFYSISTAGSGAALDQAGAVVAYSATGSGAKPVGVNTLDVVNKDLTKTHLNFYNNEMQVGGKAHIQTNGWVNTNMIIGTPTAGATAYLAASGNVSPTRTNTGWPQVGYFLSTKDEDGYAKLQIQIVQGV